MLPAFYEKKKDTDADMLHPDVIVVDPPRKGCDRVCLETMLKMQPERIVYVSCDSATLARDLKVLCEGGYELRKVRAVDQFGLIAFGSFSDIIKRNLSLTLTKLNFYVDMSVWLFVGKQYYRLHMR